MVLDFIPQVEITGPVGNNGINGTPNYRINSEGTASFIDTGTSFNIDIDIELLEKTQQELQTENKVLKLKVDDLNKRLFKLEEMVRFLTEV